MSKNDTNIDLQCSLCPKNPKFSDLSHLLTHLNSKGHLARKNEVEIRSKSDYEVKVKLAAFDSWFHNSNLGPLLAGRLAAKDQKKAKESKDKSNRAPSVGPKKGKIAHQNTTDPRLTTTPAYRAPVPNMLPNLHHFDVVAATPSTAVASEWQPTPGYNSPYGTPTSRRDVPNFTGEHIAASFHVDPNLVTPMKLDQLEKDVDRSGGKLKLKGIVLDGMDLFDSATEENVKMRNQPKDDSVLQKMIATSLAIEPAEISYHPNGDFRASRDVYGPISIENTPEPSPKKRKTRKAAALSIVSANVPRVRAPRKKKAAGLGSPESRAPAMKPQPQVILRAPPTLNPLAAGLGSHFVTPAEEDEEFRMTRALFGTKKRNFNIFQDVPELQPEVSPGRTESPLEEHRFDFPHHSLPSYPNNSSNASHIPPSPTPVAKPLSFRNFGKENIQPEMSAGQAFPQQPRRQPATFQFYTPYTPETLNFYGAGAPYNPLYNEAYARAFAHASGVFSTEYTAASTFTSSTFNGEFKPVASIADPQQHQGKLMGSSAKPATGFNFASTKPQQQQDQLMAAIIASSTSPRTGFNFASTKSLMGL